VMRDKPANRMPEASFLAFAPASAQEWQLHKLGIWLPAAEVVRNGGGALQAVSALQAKLPSGATLRITPFDSPLIAPLDAPFMTFTSAPPDFSAGVRFNLHNNKWGTNFPMWCAGTLRFRFDLEIF